MDIFKYIWPDEWVLRIIILVMVSLACWIGYTLYVIYERGIAGLNAIEEIDDVHILQEQLRRNLFSKETANKIFDEEFAGEYEIEKRPVYEHVRTIYLAGLECSHLDPELLVRNTVDKTFVDAERIKSWISLFLVFGILGTLCGLAISIGGFTNANFDLSTHQVSLINSQLSQLFSQLKGAFAPSIWGVSLTILFVGGYSWLIQEKAIGALTEKLTEKTIKDWIPRLYPTDFQRGENTMVKLNETIKNAEGINSGVNELQNNLKVANATISALAGTSSAIERATSDFKQGVSQIGNLQSLYEQLEGNNKTFQASLAGLVEETKRVNFAVEQGQDLRWQQVVGNINDNVEAMRKNYLEQLGELKKNVEIYFSNFSVTHAEQQSILQEIYSRIDTYTTQFGENCRKLISELDVAAKANRDSFAQNNEMQIAVREVLNSLAVYQKEMGNLLVTPIEERLQKMDQSFRQVATSIDNLSNPMREIVDGMDRKMNNVFNNIEAVIHNMDKIVQTNSEARDNRLLREIRDALVDLGKSPERKIEQPDKIHRAEAIDVSSSLSSKKTKKGRYEYFRDWMPVIIGGFLAIIVVLQIVMVNKLSDIQAVPVTVQSQTTDISGDGAVKSGTSTAPGQNQ